MSQTPRAGMDPEWDGDRVDDRPVAHCQECGALWFITDIRYEGEAALGGPNFSYQKDDQVPFPGPEGTEPR